MKARNGVEKIKYLSFNLGGIRGSVRSGLKSICCSQKWHREYLVVIRDFINGTLPLLLMGFNLRGRLRVVSLVT